jgi:transcriptional regulator of arginine metabolism
MGVIKTRPGYASAIAWNIDGSDLPCILGTIAGDDTIFIAIREGVSQLEVIQALRRIIPNMK